MKNENFVKIFFEPKKYYLLIRVVKLIKSFGIADSVLLQQILLYHRTIGYEYLEI